MKKIYAIPLLLLLLVGCTEEKGTNADDPITVDTLSFTEDIMPIFEAHCIECHGDFWPDGDYDLTTYSQAMTSGQHAPNIVPFHPESSFIIHVISPYDTTDHDGPYPDETVIQPITEWISQGALDN